MPSILPERETQINAWINNFVGVATANFTVLGVSQLQLTDLSGENATFVDDLQAVNDQKAALKGATTNKNATRKDLEKSVTALNKIIQGRPTVTPALKKSLGLNPGDTMPAPVTPLQPVKLTGTADASGFAFLDWKSGGNKSATTYEIFAKRGSATEFVMIGSTGKTAFKDSNATPGVSTIYKVRARRAERFSEFSLPYVLYPAGNANSLLLKVA